MTSEYSYNAVMLAHGGEIGIKSKTTRRFMIKTLYQNITGKFPDYNLKFKNISNRTIIYSNNPEKLARGIADIIFGVSHAAPIYIFPWTTYEELLTICTHYSSRIMKPGFSFGYAARSSGKNHPSSQQLKVELGSKLYEYFDGKITVNLTDPDFLFTVEVREGIAWIYHEMFQGPDGFPPGVQKGIIYGNIRFWVNDYLAIYQVLKRGVKVKPVRFITHVELSTIEEEVHTQFLGKFVYKKSIDIPMYSLLSTWKEKFGNNLCSACMLFSESLLFKASGNRNTLGYTSGLKLAQISGDITQDGLKWLETEIIGFKIRPNLTSTEEPSKYNKFFENFPIIKSCCSFQNQRMIFSKLSKDDVQFIEQSVQEYLNRYFSIQGD